MTIPNTEVHAKPVGREIDTEEQYRLQGKIENSKL